MEKYDCHVIYKLDYIKKKFNKLNVYDEIIQVYSIDPSMDLKEHDCTSKIYFYPIGLSGKDGILEVGIEAGNSDY